MYSSYSLMKNKGDLERERDELRAELDSARNKLQVLDRTVEHLKKALDEKVSWFSDIIYSFPAVNWFNYQRRVMRFGDIVECQRRAKLSFLFISCVPHCPLLSLILWKELTFFIADKSQTLTLSIF